MKLGLSLLGAVVAVLLTTAMLFTSGWTKPPILATQTGFRGTAMNELVSAHQERVRQLANVLPDAIEAAPAGGERATKTYKNVKVLTDLSTEQFNRVMIAITQWVSPDQGCAYCHNGENFADDGLYTKTVARRMLQMTRHLNKDWKAHVADTGVTCYTCHRGQPVPSNVWQTDPGKPHAGGFSATNDGFGHPSPSNGTTSLLYDPLTPYLLNTEQIRVSGKEALPKPEGASIQTTEKTFALMIHMSQSLGVNCVFCHNSRAFGDWSQSTPQRVTAWHGLEMLRDLNVGYLDPLKTSYPANRLGPLGDAPKANCATCHQGVSKPLLGASMAKDFPELGGGH
jgi:photosynthetic reaction center cytochrome c subunit